MSNEVTQAANKEPFFGIQRIFLKGTSLELPSGAMTFLEKDAPKLELNLQVDTVELAKDTFETVVRATLAAKVNEKSIFLLEVEQAGVFEARNLTAEQHADVREISAPAILAPYLRSQLTDTLVRATLPPFYMPEVNWPHMAAQARAAREKGQAPTAQQVLH